MLKLFIDILVAVELCAFHSGKMDPAFSTALHYAGDW